MRTSWKLPPIGVERRLCSLFACSEGLFCGFAAHRWMPDGVKSSAGYSTLTDVEGKPPEAYEHDMKLWWPHTEAICATLLAYRLTGDERYREWHRKVHERACSHFPDDECGEWFGYLHRDGSLSSRVEGNMWKGPFHLPRMQLLSWKLLEEMLVEKSAGESKA